MDQLRTDGVPYQLTDGGATILVPQEKVYDERLKAASAGLPATSTGGYSLLDKMGVTSSEFQQNVTYKRAMEGELGNTIGAMKGVKTASVRLAIPEETVFAAEKKDPTASVFVETQNGVHPQRRPGPGHRAPDERGGRRHEADRRRRRRRRRTVLSTVGGGATGGADKQAGDYETRVKAAVQEMLDKVVGVGNATVAVAADVSSETRPAHRGVVHGPDRRALAERVRRRRRPTPAPAAARAPACSARTTSPSRTARNGNGTFNSESSTKDNAVDKVTEQRTIPAGAINRQTVSVALNSDAVGGVSANEVRSLVERGRRNRHQARRLGERRDGALQQDGRHRGGQGAAGDEGCGSGGPADQHHPHLGHRRRHRRRGDHRVHPVPPEPPPRGRAG